MRTWKQVSWVPPLQRRWVGKLFRAHTMKVKFRDGWLWVPERDQEKADSVLEELQELGVAKTWKWE